MTLSREEIAVRFAVEYAVRNRFAPENAVRQGFQAADAFAEECARRSFATPVPPVDPVREAERAVVEAADAWTVAYDKNDYPDSGHSERIRLSDAIDALRAARKARGGAS